MKTILAICGSIRENSTNYHVLKNFSSLLPPDYKTEIYTELNQLPYFDSSTDPDKLPEIVTRLKQKIEQADGLVICTPEYVFSLPGVLKNAIEWMVSSTVFSGKKTALIVASGMGDMAFESLGLIMKTLEADFNDHTKLLLRGVRGKVNTEGVITDGETYNDLKKLSESFIKHLQSPAGGK